MRKICTNNKRDGSLKTAVERESPATCLYLSEDWELDGNLLPLSKGKVADYNQLTTSIHPPLHLLESQGDCGTSQTLWRIFSSGDYTLAKT